MLMLIRQLTSVIALPFTNEWPVRAANAKTLVFQQETGTRRDCMPSGKPLEADWRPVVDNFRAENASPRTVRPGFPLGRPYIVVPRADIEAQLREFPRDQWSGGPATISSAATLNVGASCQ